MKKIILIGKMNTMSKDLHTLLADDYQVQLCSDALDVVEGMVKIVQPDLVLVSLNEEAEQMTAILSYLKESCAELPVLTIGTEEERRHYLRFYWDDRFENLTRPIDNRQIVEAIGQKLRGSAPPAETASTEAERAKVLVVDDNAALDLALDVGQEPQDAVEHLLFALVLRFHVGTGLG